MDSHGTRQQGTNAFSAHGMIFFVSPSLETHRTSYDPVRKQHWLSVYRQNLAVRFLLKDHGQRKNNHDSRQTESLILNAVDQMVAAINQADHQGSRP